MPPQPHIAFPVVSPANVAPVSPPQAPPSTNKTTVMNVTKSPPPPPPSQSNSFPVNQPKQNGTETNTTPQNKSWASLFNKDKNEEEKKPEVVVVNGCGKVEDSPIAAEECDDEFAAIKKNLKAK